MGAPGGYGLWRFERRNRWASPRLSMLRTGLARIMFAMLPCAKTTGATAGAGAGAGAAACQRAGGEASGEEGRRLESAQG